jgi:hypothetical protein
MFKPMHHRPVLMMSVGLVVGLAVGLGMMIGTLVTVGHQQAGSLRPPDTLLHAVASHSGDTFAMATGPVDSDVEGLFTLDYLTGDLQCWVLYPRAGTFGGHFRHNVISDLGVERGKNPNYVIVTGQADFQRGGTAATPALSAVYVADANTGNFAAYGLMWNRTLARSNTPQRGAFVLLGTGKARDLEIRQ